jgi:hypothetical protein
MCSAIVVNDEEEFFDVATMRHFGKMKSTEISSIDVAAF